jgi:hypothetical protein
VSVCLLDTRSNSSVGINVFEELTISIFRVRKFYTLKTEALGTLKHCYLSIRKLSDSSSVVTITNQMLCRRANLFSTYVVLVVFLYEAMDVFTYTYRLNRLCKIPFAIWTFLEMLQLLLCQSSILCEMRYITRYKLALRKAIQHVFVSVKRTKWASLQGFPAALFALQDHVVNSSGVGVDLKASSAIFPESSTANLPPLVLGTD